MTGPYDRVELEDGSMTTRTAAEDAGLLRTLDDVTLSERAAVTEAVGYLLREIERLGGELTITRNGEGWIVWALADPQSPSGPCRLTAKSTGDDLPATLQMVASDVGEMIRRDEATCPGGC